MMKDRVLYQSVLVTYPFDTYDCTKRKIKLTGTFTVQRLLVPREVAAPARHRVSAAMVDPSVLPSTTILDVGAGSGVSPVQPAAHCIEA